MKLFSVFFFCLLILISSCSSEDPKPKRQNCSLSSLEVKYDSEGEVFDETNNYPIMIDSDGKITQGYFWEDQIVSFSYSPTEILATTKGKSVKYYLNDSNLIYRAELDQSGSLITLTFEYSEDEKLIRINNKSNNIEVKIGYENGNFTVFESETPLEYSSDEPYINTMILKHTPFYFANTMVLASEIKGCNILYGQGYFGKLPQNRIISLRINTGAQTYPANKFYAFSYNFDENGKLTSVIDSHSFYSNGRNITRIWEYNYSYQCE